MTMRTLIVITTLLLLNLGNGAQANSIEALQFEDSQQQVRYQQLIAELRCLVCQNQNLADSNAELAKDLRRKTHEMIIDGKSNKHIKSYMQQRYGDFVLYDPPFNMSTALLWIGPFILLAICLFMLFINIKRRQDNELIRAAHANNEDERVQVRNLLKNTPELGKADTDRRSAKED